MHPHEDFPAEQQVPALGTLLAAARLGGCPGRGQPPVAPPRPDCTSCPAGPAAGTAAGAGPAGRPAPGPRVAAERPRDGPATHSPPEGGSPRSPPTRAVPGACQPRAQERSDPCLDEVRECYAVGPPPPASAPLLRRACCLSCIRKVQHWSRVLAGCADGQFCRDVKAVGARGRGSDLPTGSSPKLSVSQQASKLEWPGPAGCRLQRLPPIARAALAC